MAQVFVSYSQADRKRVNVLVEALRAEGFDVWWDKGVLAGTQWRRELDAQLAAAQAIVPVWTATSVASDWVIEEAAFGKRRGLLCPVRIDPVEPPIGFTTIQLADLTGWKGSRRNETWRHFVSSLRQLVYGEAGAGAGEERARRRWRQFAPLAALLALCFAALWLIPLWTGLPLADTLRGTSAERAAWRQLRAGGDCKALALYAAQNSQSPFASDARALVARPRMVTAQGWAPRRDTLPAFGASTNDRSQAAACASARAAAQRSAGDSCGLFAKGQEKVRNLTSRLAGDACSCQDIAGHWQCTVDTKAECSWQVRDVVTREVCA